jgi:class 3 adenylate cyclase
LCVVRRDAVRYATSGDLRIAYQQFGEGSLDLVMVPGFVSNLDMVWESPAFAPILERLGSFARCSVFDKRGTGLSDRDFGFGSLEERMDDIRAVMDDAGIERAALFGVSEGGPLSVLFAAAYPQRATALALYGTMARIRRAPDFPEGLDGALTQVFLEEVERRWGTGHALRAFCQHIPKGDDTVTEQLARYERGACSPRMARHILERNMDMDVSSVLPTVSAPTIVLHSTGDPLIPASFGRYLADGIPGARFVEHDADYHMTYNGKDAWYLDELEKFFTGTEPKAAQPTERFLATVLFTDIVDSTKRASELGDRAWRELLDRHDKISGDSVAAYGGRMIKTTGDGVLATLEGPSRAVECAFAIRDAVDKLGVKIRAGVHTGEVERRGDDVGGIGVNIGSRVAALAGPGEVWVSRTVKDLTIGSGLQFEERGRHALKGIPDEWDLFSLV